MEQAGFKQVGRDLEQVPSGAGIGPGRGSGTACNGGVRNGEAEGRPGQSGLWVAGGDSLAGHAPGPSILCAELGCWAADVDKLSCSQRIPRLREDRL